jgi:hypothetical protein
MRLRKRKATPILASALYAYMHVVLTYTIGRLYMDRTIWRWVSAIALLMAVSLVLIG